MYSIYGNIYHQYTPNVSIYTIHGSYGIGNITFSDTYVGKKIHCQNAPRAGSIGGQISVTITCQLSNKTRKDPQWNGNGGHISQGVPGVPGVPVNSNGFHDGRNNFKNSLDSQSYQSSILDGLRGSS